MPISVFDAAVVGGDTDPNVANATPGCLLSFASGDAHDTPIEGDDPDRRPSIRIPPSYVAGGVAAYWARVSLDAAGKIQVRTATTNTETGGATGPELTDAAEADIGLAFRAPDGSTISFLLSLLNDPTEPYERQIQNFDGSSPAFSTSPVSTFSADEWRACKDGFDAAAGGQVVIVDTSDPNVDWDNLEFLSATAVIPVVLPTTADQTATVGDAFSLTLPEATAGTSPYDYAATGLPPGLAFNSTSRVISGTPTTAGTYSVAYSVEDDAGETDSDTFDIVVSAAADPLALPGTADQTATVGVAFSITLPEATGGATPYAYTATLLPAGLSFNASSRVLSGTPTTAQSRNVRYRVTDDDGTRVTDRFIITVSAAPVVPVVLPTTADQTATVGNAFSLTLPAATEGTTPYVYTATGLPPGVNFNATSRVLSGTPTAAGTYTVTYEVTDDAAETASDTFDIVVAAAGQPLALPGTADQVATVGDAFTLTLPAATGGSTPYSYTVTGQPGGPHV